MPSITENLRSQEEARKGTLLELSELDRSKIRYAIEAKVVSTEIRLV